jgi:hypothetical protein
MADLFTTNRLSLLDLRGLSTDISGHISSTNHDLLLYQAQKQDAFQQSQFLHQQRAELEAALQRNAEDMDRTMFELQEAERGEMECTERLRVLHDVELEMEAIKERALDDLKMTLGKIPPKVLAIRDVLCVLLSRVLKGTPLLAAGSSLRHYQPVGNFQPDPEAENALAADIRQAIIRRPSQPVSNCNKPLFNVAYYIDMTLN